MAQKLVEAVVPMAAAYPQLLKDARFRSLVGILELNPLQPSVVRWLHFSAMQT